MIIRSRTTNRYRPVVNSAQSWYRADRNDMQVTKTMGQHRINGTGRPSRTSIKLMTSSVSPASNWFVVPKSGQISIPPVPPEPAPKASTMQVPTAASVAT